jgi:hypothetical protein
LTDFRNPSVESNKYESRKLKEYHFLLLALDLVLAEEKGLASEWRLKG